VTHSRKSSAQRAKSLERLRAFRERRKQEEAAPPKPYVPSPEFANYPPPHCELGPVGMIWREGERYPTWVLPVHELTHAPRRAYIPRLTPNH
jgi:hypothetical protein